MRGWDWDGSARMSSERELGSSKQPEQARRARRWWAMQLEQRTRADTCYGPRGMQANNMDMGAYEDLFSFACPKFISPAAPKYDEGLAEAHLRAVSVWDLREFTEENDCWDMSTTDVKEKVIVG